MANWHILFDHRQGHQKQELSTGELYHSLARNNISG